MINETDEYGNLKWSCEECNHIWYGGFFYTFIDCPECGSEYIGHY